MNSLVMSQLLTNFVHYDAELEQLHHLAQSYGMMDLELLGPALIDKSDKLKWRRMVTGKALIELIEENS